MNTLSTPFVDGIASVSTRSILLLGCIAISACSTSVQQRPGLEDREAVRYEASEPLPDLAVQSFERAKTLMSQGSWVEAELELQHLALEYEGLPGPYVNLAIVYQRDGRDMEAEQALQRALSIDPGFAPAGNQLGMLMRRQGRFVEAEEAYRIALDADPEYALARHNLAILLDLYLRRADEALEQYVLYQQSLAEPDERVARWIIDLERRVDRADERLAVDEAR